MNNPSIKDPQMDLRLATHSKFQPWPQDCFKI